MMMATLDMSIGIDPGKTGGYAFVVGYFVQYNPLDLTLFIEDIKGWNKTHTLRAVVERQWSRPKQNVKAMDKLMCNFCTVKGILMAFDIPYIEVAPQTWRAQVLQNATATKQDAFTFAEDRYGITLKKEYDGIADAICIAHYKPPKD